MMQLFTGYSVPIQKSVTAQAPACDHCNASSDTTRRVHISRDARPEFRFRFCIPLRSVFRQSATLRPIILSPLVPLLAPACGHYNTLASEQTDSHDRRAQWRSASRAALVQTCKHSGVRCEKSKGTRPENRLTQPLSMRHQTPSVRFTFLETLVRSSDSVFASPRGQCSVRALPSAPSFFLHSFPS